jgi:hypothetical protein
VQRFRGCQRSPCAVRNLATPHHERGLHGSGPSGLEVCVRHAAGRVNDQEDVTQHAALHRRHGGRVTPARGSGRAPMADGRRGRGGGGGVGHSRHASPSSQGRVGPQEAGLILCHLGCPRVLIRPLPRVVATARPSAGAGCGTSSLTSAPMAAAAHRDRWQGWQVREPVHAAGGRAAPGCTVANRAAVWVASRAPSARQPSRSTRRGGGRLREGGGGFGRRATTPPDRLCTALPLRRRAPPRQAVRARPP